jgi:AcrR family transcriptional regulator
MSSVAKIVEPRWERRKDARPIELADAALELFVERGFAATRLDDVAKRAGVSKGTLYLYFDSKDDLFKAIVRNGIVSRFVEFESQLLAYQGSSADLMRLMIKTWWEKIGATKLAGISKLIISEVGNFPELARFYHDEVISRGVALFSSAIQRGIDSGEFRPIELVHTPHICAAPVLMLMLWRNSFDLCGVQKMDPEQYLATHTDLLIRGLLAGHSSAAH